MSQDLNISQERAEKIENRIRWRMRDRSNGVPICTNCYLKTGMEVETNIRFSTVSKNPLREDLGFKCPKCRHHMGFGIPITREEYEKELELRNGSRYDPLKGMSFVDVQRLDRQKEAEEKVKKRLSRLGYIPRTENR